MTFNINIGVVSTFHDRIRFIPRTQICNKSQYDIVVKSLTDYLTCEGFLLTAEYAANISKFNVIGPDLPDIKNLLCQKAVDWHLEVWDNHGVRVHRDNCPV